MAINLTLATSKRSKPRAAALLQALTTLITFTISTFTIFTFTQSYAEDSRLPPMVRKNVNEVTTFFDDEIEDRKSLETEMNQSLERGVAGIESGEAAGMLKGDGDGDLEGQARTLGNMDLNEAESKGFTAKAEDSELWSKAFIDYNDPMIIRHKEDIDEIAKATEKLTGKLKDMYEKLGVDCKQLKGEVDIEPEMYIEIDRVPQKEVIYDKYLCEYLRNTYSCGDTLTVKCSDPGFVPGRLTNVTGNMTHTLDSNGTLTIGVNKTAYFYNAWGSQHDFNFSFNIDNAKGIDSFKLLKIDWADYVLVKLNGSIVYQGPRGYGKIEMSQDRAHWRVGPDDERYFGVDLGNGVYVPANTKRYYTDSPNIEAKQFLVDGTNHLDIRLVYGKGGKIWTQIKFTERVCNNWQETWDEKCSLK